MGTKPPGRGPRPADIELEANVRACRLHFDEVPGSEVELWGEPGNVGHSGSDRENLPDEVEPDVTYRHVTVHYRVANKLLDEGPKR